MRRARWLPRLAVCNSAALMEQSASMAPMHPSHSSVSDLSAKVCLSNPLRHRKGDGRDALCMELLVVVAAPGGPHQPSQRALPQAQALTGADGGAARNDMRSTHNNHSCRQKHQRHGQGNGRLDDDEATAPHDGGLGLSLLAACC